MNDYHYIVQNEAARIRGWALGQMLWGALIAGVAVVAIGVMLGAIWLLGEFLPERSKEAPSPYGALEIVQRVSVA